MTQVKCDNCGWAGDVSETEEYRDFWSRVDVGGEVPAGDCPKCGAFAYLVKPATVPPTDLLTAVKSMQGWAKNFSELLSIHHPGSISEKPHGPFNQDMEKASVAIAQAEAATATVPPKLWIILYHHRHGQSAWPVYAEPDLDAEAEALDDFEPERDEYLESFGPFDNPGQGCGDVRVFMPQG